LNLISIGIIILLFILLLVAMFVIPRWLMGRALRQVIRIFRDYNATESQTARTVDELGMRPPGVLERMMRRRDYKPHALSSLRQAGVIQTTEDGKLYLSEEKLTEFGLEKGASSYG
jgi:hypothetical protein